MDWDTLNVPSLLQGDRRRQHRERHVLSLPNPEVVDSVKFLKVAYLNRSEKDQRAPRAERARDMGAWVVVFPTSLCDPWLLLVRTENKGKQLQATWELAPHSLHQAGQKTIQLPPHRGFARDVCKTLRGNAGWSIWVSRLLKLKDRIYLHNLKRKKKSHLGRKIGLPWVVKPLSLLPEMSQGL